ncbi:MAG: hypothetical protein ABSA12_05895 [Verrucomicrobiia bacterium]
MNVSHGCLTCTACKDLFTAHDLVDGFERWGEGERIRLINNPASWGSNNPTYSLLGFSKGNTQNKVMADVKAGRATFESVPFKGMRKRLGWLLHALGLVGSDEQIDRLFQTSERRFQSASLIRCSISVRNQKGEYLYKLKDILAADGPSNGKVREIIRRCSRRHLSGAKAGQSFILLGLDKEQIQWCKAAFAEIYGPLKSLNETAYRTDHLSWVHVAHPSGSQTDPQYLKWCQGKTSTAKVVWARDELGHRNRTSGR